MTAPARARIPQQTTGLSHGFPAREPSPKTFPPASGNENLSARTDEGPVLADAPEPLARCVERGRP